ncbi:MAG: hypothetical protein LBG68_03490 [Coriobacteriales bacterium]|jgi:hypothetical protein|nr:hypothetical protein [Coriobacteriales bacterium]
MKTQESRSVEQKQKTGENSNGSRVRDSRSMLLRGYITLLAMFVLAVLVAWPGTAEAAVPATRLSNQSINLVMPDQGSVPITPSGGQETSSEQKTASGQAAATEQTASSEQSVATGQGSNTGQAEPQKFEPAAPTIYKTITYDANRGMPVQEELLLSESGQQYRLDQISTPQPAEGAIHQRYYNATMQGELTVAQVEAGPDSINQAFPSTMRVQENGFTGSIALVDVKTEPVYLSIREPVECQLLIDNLPSADIRDLPTSYVFTVSSDEYLGATCQSELERLSVSTAVDTYADDGRPQTYIAILVFRGYQDRLVLDHYQATAYYAGTVPAEVQLVSVTASYVLVPNVTPPVVSVVSEPQVPAAPPEAIIASPEAPAPAPTLSLPLLFAGAVVLALIVLIPFIYYWLRPDARLVREAADSSRETLLARRLRRQLDLMIFELPEDFDLSSLSLDCRLLLRGRRYRQAQSIEIQQAGRLIYSASPEPIIEISKLLWADSGDAVSLTELGFNESELLELEEPIGFETNLTLHAETI